MPPDRRRTTGSDPVDSAGQGRRRQTRRTRSGSRSDRRRAGSIGRFDRFSLRQRRLSNRAHRMLIDIAAGQASDRTGGFDRQKRKAVAPSRIRSLFCFFLFLFFFFRSDLRRSTFSRRMRGRVAMAPPITSRISPPATESHQFRPVPDRRPPAPHPVTRLQHRCCDRYSADPPFVLRPPPPPDSRGTGHPPSLCHLPPLPRRPPPRDRWKR